MIDLIDTNAQEIFFDGIDEAKTVNGVVRFAVFIRQDSTGVVVARLSVPLEGLPDVIQALVICLSEAAKGGSAAN